MAKDFGCRVQPPKKELFMAFIYEIKKGGVFTPFDLKSTPFVSTLDEASIVIPLPGDPQERKLLKKDLFKLLDSYGRLREGANLDEDIYVIG